MTAPSVDGQPSLPKRRGPKGLLPSTWLERTLKVAYMDCYGSGQETSGTLLDFYPAGPILNVAGARTLISWDRLVLCELVEDWRGEMRMNHKTTLGHQRLPYGTPAAEEMISDRMKKLAEKGRLADRQVA